MSKKSLILLVVAAFVMSLGFGVTMSLAEADKGDAEITLNPDNRDKKKKGKPAIFPHAAHQENEKIDGCGTCHHTEDGGKQVPSDKVKKDGSAKCGTCHNADFATEKLRKWKGVGHGLCNPCHPTMKADCAPTNCAGCHPKKK